ncbi:purine-uracil permease NCS1-like [Canna indica]|uniref:Purine-uracil permease NCS1-like n=1 Tax=Canna indica TaxID=4628 RepID=A0AAQ3KMF6_9LILI|nr:purine-uracil permease NCS1-like [Canna indica]
MEAADDVIDPSAGDGLDPIPAGKRTLSCWGMATLWVSMVVGVPTYYTAASLVELGMSWWQGVATIFLGNLVVSAPICLTAHAGTQYGVSFPIQLRSAFGVRGARVPALLRAVVACGWCGIESWIGGQAIFLLLLPISMRSSHYAKTVDWLGTSPLEIGCFLLFSLLQFAVLWKGMTGIYALGMSSAPVLVLLVSCLFAWAYAAAGGFGEMLSAPSRLAPPQFWSVFFPSLTGCVGSWATVALNISDFSRFARSQADQVFGQIGLPLFMAAYAFGGLAITSATEVIFGRPISDPLELLSRINTNFFISIIAFLGIGLAIITTNIPANFVAPANVLVSLSPSTFSFTTGSLVTAVISVAFQPWKIMGSSQSYVYAWLVGCSAVLGPITGIMLTDYYVLRRTRLHKEGLYSDSAYGPYYYTGGYNVAGFIALAAGVGPAIPGFLHEVGVLKTTWKVFDVIYGSAWFFGVFFASLVYWVLSCACSCRKAKDKACEAWAVAPMAEPLLRHTGTP